MESSLHKAAMKIVAIVNRDKDHIPPITTSDANPFPYQIVLNPKQEVYSHGFVICNLNTTVCPDRNFPV